MAQGSFCGTDVAKDRLDVMVLPEGLCWSVDNDAAGWAELVDRLRGLGIAASGIEASGGYERGVVRALLAVGMSVRQINPSLSERSFCIATRRGWWRRHSARCPARSAIPPASDARPNDADPGTRLSTTDVVAFTPTWVFIS